VTGIWLEASLEGPEGVEVLPAREWLDRFGVESRTERPVEAGAPWWLGRPADVERDLRPIDHIGEFPALSAHRAVLAVHGGKIAPGHVDLPAMSGLFASFLGGAQAPSFVPDLSTVLAEHRRADVARALSADPGTVVLPSDAQDIAAAEGRVEQAIFDLERASAHATLVGYAALAWAPEEAAWRAAPCVLSVETTLSPRGSTKVLDVWHDALSGVGAAAQPASALRRSVRNALAESIVSASPAPDGGATSSVAGSYFDAIKAGVPLAAATGDDVLTSFALLGPEVLGRMRTSIAGAFAIVGAREAPLSGSPLAGFWAISLTSGAALAVGRSGRHAAMTEYEEGQRQALLRMNSLRNEGLRPGACRAIIAELEQLFKQLGAAWKDGGVAEGFIIASLHMLKKFCKDIPYGFIVP
jgi:hypothetical protein